MLHRFLFVAGMTLGVMTPLVWAAYVARPAAPTAHNAQGPTTRIADAVPGKAAPDVKNPDVKMMPPAPSDDVTASIPSGAPSSQETAAPTPPEPAGSRPESEHARAAGVATPPRPMTIAGAREDKDRALPAVVDNYNGAHIITVCAALTENEQLRAGCP